MNSQQFAWDDINELFYYISYAKEGYVEIEKTKEPEVYEFLMCIYGVSSRVIDLSKYTKFNSMLELSNH